MLDPNDVYGDQIPVKQAIDMIKNQKHEECDGGMYGLKVMEYCKDKIK
jgi:hypothetical protein